MSGINARIIPGKHEIAEGSNGLRESGLNPELKSKLDQVREGYQKHKIKERMAKAKRKRHYRLGSAVIFLALTGLIMVLKFWG
jgi:hypothetical protein